MTAPSPSSHIRSVAATARLLRWIGAMGIVAIAVLRCIVVFAPQVYFDVDPAFDPAPLAGLGPAGSLTLDALLLAFAAMALAGEALSRRGLEHWLLILALAPLPVLYWHGRDDMGDLWRGSTWLAAMVAAGAVAHLARDATMRAILLALLLAVAAPLLLRGIGQMTFEHAATVAAFEENKAQFLADHGWEPGSSAAEIYERRLRQPQPLGWFATTNIYASQMLAATIVLAGIAFGLRRAKLPLRWPLLLGAMAACCAAAVLFTGSKGAVGAMLIAIAVAIVPIAGSSFSLPFVRRAPLLLSLLPILGLMAVIVRGLILPEHFAGDRSLLFRWHYLLSAERIFTDSPQSALLGIGPDGFQDTYVQHRPERSPEEVASSHSMFIDWLTMLGILGAAWIGIVVAFLHRAGRSFRERTEYLAGEDIEQTMQRLARCAVIALVVALVPAIVIELHALDTLHLVLRIVGAMMFAITALLIGYLALHLERSTLAWTVAAAAAALVLHGQIEMTFFQPGFVAWAMCLIGLAAPSGVRPTPQPRRGVIGATIILLLGVAVFVFAAVPAWRQQSLVRRAAASLYPPATTPEQQVLQRERAARLLEDAAAIQPRHDVLLLLAVREHERAAHRAHREDRADHLERAVDVLAGLDRDDIETPPIAMYAARSSVAMQLAVISGENLWFDQATHDARVLARRDPHNPVSWLRLGELYWMTRQYDLAADAYRTALQKSENFALDPLKQLPAQQQGLIEDRLKTINESLMTDS